MAERRQANKEKIANTERALLEIDDYFTQTYNTENKDLYKLDKKVVTTPLARLIEPTIPSTGVSAVDPSLLQNTLLEFEIIITKGPVWPGSQDIPLGNVGPDALPVSRLAHLWRRRNLDPKEVNSRRNKGPDS